MFLMSARLVGILLLGVKSSGHNPLTRCHCDPLRSTVRWSCWTIRPSALGAVAGLPCAVAPEGSSFVHVLEPWGPKKESRKAHCLGCRGPAAPPTRCSSRAFRVHRPLHQSRPKNETQAALGRSKTGFERTQAGLKS